MGCLPAYKVGQLVYLRADPTVQGSIIEVMPPVGGKTRYRVFHSIQEIREYNEDQIALAQTGTKTPWADMLRRGEWLDANTFKARLTAARLKHRQTDTLYALHAARIKYIPFQFKPLLRFLRADQPRLFIADEVGVGKTIEAGLILKELAARQTLGNVLIVCPKSLVSKWRAEMQRFDERFYPLTSNELRYCLRETNLDGNWPSRYGRAIVHHELLRMDAYLHGTAGRRPQPGLFTLDPPPQFDLVIVDEAHHLRTPESNTHEMARFLCDVAEAVLFLSATPVHTGSKNLFTLLNLLRPDLFPSMDVFREVVKPNRHVIRAMCCVRGCVSEMTWQKDAADSLQAAASAGRGIVGQDPRCQQWLAKLEGGPLSDKDRIACLRDLEEIHSLAHIMNRTRRRDIGRFTVREPSTIRVPFTSPQRTFYEALVSFRRETLFLNYDPVVVGLISETVERQASSCLPALLPFLENFIKTGRIRPLTVSDSLDVEDEDVSVPNVVRQHAEALRQAANALPPEDPKLEKLFEIVSSTLEANGPGKVLVFSFFLHTLDYLLVALREKGVRVGLVTGKVDDFEREELRSRFRLSRGDARAIDVLLSSEVGCEGLDYEFCDRMVNYDIPWNPMRIEQRIGRIDRFGQQSEKVLIFNFVTPDTVEERIFFRCFERLGVFRDTVGDLEDVLGDMVQDMTRAALDPSLSAEQVQLRTQQLLDNALRMAEEQRRLEAAAMGLMGLEKAFVDEVDRLVDDGRFVSAEDIRQMIESFLQVSEISGVLVDVADDPGVVRMSLKRTGRDELAARARKLDRRTAALPDFLRWLDGSDSQLLLTFQQDVALERRQMPFVTPLHPLSRLAVNHWMAQERAIVGHVRSCEPRAPQGRYLFVCDLWETVGVRSEVRVVTHAWDLDRNRAVGEVASSILKLSVVSEPSDMPESLSDSEAILQQLEEAAEGERRQALEELQGRNRQLIDRQLASLDSYVQTRTARIEMDLRRATDERIVRMKQSELARIKREYDERRTEIEGRCQADILRERLAVGFLEITHV